MTEPDVRVLLAELAQTVEAPDLASTAWDHSVRRRRRRAAFAAGAVAAATAVAVGAVQLRTDSASTPPTHPSTTTSPPTPKTDSTLDGFSIAVAPRLADEAALPSAATPLPAVIDLSAPNPSVLDDPLLRAVAAFAIEKVVGDSTRFDGVMLVGPGGELRHLDTPRLQLLDTGDGNVTRPFSAGSLSPDGTRLAFPQPDGVTVFSIPTGQWTSFSLPASGDDLVGLYWASDTTIRVGLATLDTGAGRVTSDRFGSPLYASGLEVQAWSGVERALGDARARAAAYLAARAPAPGVDAYPPAIAVAGGGMQALLLIPDQQPRWKNCCTVASWLDPETVAYDSTSSRNPLRPEQTTRVLAWDLASGEVSLAATITGSADMLFFGSYADLSDL